MKVIYTSLTLSVLILLVACFSITLISCSDEDNARVPVITNFTPASGFPGSSVTLSGSNFGTTPANIQVTFNGVTATVTNVAATELIVTVPASATTGKITVTVNGKTATSLTDFTVLETTVTTFSPAAGIVGTTVAITGTNFSTTLLENTVKFNGVTATVTSATATELIVTVPALATTGKITVTVNGKTVTLPTDFTVLETTFTSFSPVSGIVGTTVTLTGTNFSTTLLENTVKFNGVTATVSAATSTQLTVTVPTEATTGKITVTLNGNTVTSLTDFTIPAPIISNYFPSIAAEGISVRITGINFSSVAANNIVKFNGVNATVTAASSTQLIVTVPVGATTGRLTVKVGANTVTSAGNFEICSGSAELVMSDFVISNTSGATSYLVSFKVTNVGAINADLTQMSMQNYASDDPAQGGDLGASGFSLTAGGTLLPGQSYTTPNFSCNIVGGNTSSHPVLIITLTGTVTECNTNNNVAFRTFQ